MELGIVGSIVIGVLAGFIAGKIMKGRGFGFIANFVVGLIGAVLGGFLFEIVGLEAMGILGYLIMSVVGALVFLWFLFLFGPNSKS